MCGTFAKRSRQPTFFSNTQSSLGNVGVLALATGRGGSGGRRLGALLDMGRGGRLGASHRHVREVGNVTGLDALKQLLVVLGDLLIALDLGRHELGVGEGGNDALRMRVTVIDLFALAVVTDADAHVALMKLRRSAFLVAAVRNGFLGVLDAEVLQVG